jgi:hypothetical protein
VKVRAVLTNTANHDITVSRCTDNTFDTYSTFTVNDEWGNRAHATNCGSLPDHCTPGDAEFARITTASGLQCFHPYDRRLKLKPGETLSQELLLDRLFDLRAPGRYEIKIRWENYPMTVLTVPGKFGYSRDVEVDAPENDWSRATVDSNVITLTVIP